MINGYATAKDTSAYLDKHKIIKKNISSFSVSPIAIGTHLGNMDETDSKLYQTSIEYALKNGINFIDTAINYRGMRSERDIGKVLSRLIDDGTINRGEIVISTKAGIIPGDIDAGLVPKDYLQKILLDTAIIAESDLQILGHHRHVLAPSYYQFAIEHSKKHLRVNTIDIHYIHNPELSLVVLGEKAFYQQLEALFLFYEEQVSKGNIRYYGFATWNGLLCDPKEKGYISLETVMKTLIKVVGVNHHFKFLQFPYNKIIHYAKTRTNQQVNQKYHTVLKVSQEFGLTAVTSAPFNLGKLIDREKNPEDHLLSILGEQNISSVMVGMKHLNHVINNLKLIQTNP